MTTLPSNLDFIYPTPPVTYCFMSLPLLPSAISDMEMKIGVGAEALSDGELSEGGTKDNKHQAFSQSASKSFYIRDQNWTLPSLHSCPTFSLSTFPLNVFFFFFSLGLNAESYGLQSAHGGTALNSTLPPYLVVSVTLQLLCSLR